MFASLQPSELCQFDVNYKSQETDALSLPFSLCVCAMNVIDKSFARSMLTRQFKRNAGVLLKYLMSTLTLFMSENNEFYCKYNRSLPFETNQRVSLPKLNVLSRFERMDAWTVIR